MIRSARWSIGGDLMVGPGGPLVDLDDPLVDQGGVPVDPGDSLADRGEALSIGPTRWSIAERWSIWTPAGRSGAECRSIRVTRWPISARRWSIGPTRWSIAERWSIWPTVGWSIRAAVLVVRTSRWSDQGPERWSIGATRWSIRARRRSIADDPSVDQGGALVGDRDPVASLETYRVTLTTDGPWVLMERWPVARHVSRRSARSCARASLSLNFSRGSR